MAGVPEAEAYGRSTFRKRALGWGLIAAGAAALFYGQSRLLVYEDNEREQLPQTEGAVGGVRERWRYGPNTPDSLLVLGGAAGILAGSVFISLSFQDLLRAVETYNVSLYQAVEAQSGVAASLTPFLAPQPGGVVAGARVAF